MTTMMAVIIMIVKVVNSRDVDPEIPNPENPGFSGFLKYRISGFILSGPREFFLVT